MRQDTNGPWAGIIASNIADCSRLNVGSRCTRELWIFSVSETPDLIQPAHVCKVMSDLSCFMAFRSRSGDVNVVRLSFTTATEPYRVPDLNGVFTARRAR
jgi:hypothetical protein